MADNIEAVSEQEAAFLQSVLDALSAHLAILDNQGIVRAVNASWRRFADENGLSWADYGIGRDYLGAFADATGEGAEDAKAAAQGVHAVLDGTLQEFHYEYPCDSPDEQRWFIMWATPVDLLGSRGVVIAHENITARKIAELQTTAARLEAERAHAAEVQQRLLSQRREAIAAALKDVLALLNSDLPLQEVLETIVGQARNLLGACSVHLLLTSGSDLAVVADHDERYSPDEEAQVEYDPAELLAMGRDSGLVVVDVSCDWDASQVSQAGARLLAPVRVSGQYRGALVAQFDRPREIVQDEVDLVADLALQISLAVDNAELRERVHLGATEAERTRLLRELHDSVSQSLFSANLIADALPRIWEQHPQEARSGLEEIRRLSRSALLEMRGLLLDLGPVALAEQPLDVLLTRLADSVSSRSQIAIDRSLDASPGVPQHVKINLYRIAEEALNNAVKHARATRIGIALMRTETGLELGISDNGRGFEADSVSPGHLGLDIMRGRAGDIGASLIIHSSRVTGTSVVAKWDADGSRQ